MSVMSSHESGRGSMRGLACSLLASSAKRLSLYSQLLYTRTLTRGVAGILGLPQTTECAADAWQCLGAEGRT